MLVWPQALPSVRLCDMTFLSIWAEKTAKNVGKLATAVIPPLPCKAPETSVDKRVRVTVARITYGLAHTLHLRSRTDVMWRCRSILHCLCAVQNLGQRRSKTWQRKGPYGPAPTQSRQRL